MAGRTEFVVNESPGEAQLFCGGETASKKDSAGKRMVKFPHSQEGFNMCPLPDTYLKGYHFDSTIML
jgi:hypothetical protein